MNPEGNAGKDSKGSGRPLRTGGTGVPGRVEWRCSRCDDPRGDDPEVDGACSDSGDPDCAPSVGSDSPLG